MATFTETLPHAGGFLLDEGNGDISREGIVIVSGEGKLSTAQVLGRITAGTASAAAKPGNAGNGTVGAITVGGAKPGVYVVTFIEPASNAGAFQVEDPDGINVGTGTVAAAFTGGGLTFTIADGAADFAAGDQIRITVAAGSGKWAALDPAGTDGRQHAAGILFREVDATSADADGTAIRRLATVRATDLVWPAGITTDQKAAALAELEALTIIAH